MSTPTVATRERITSVTAKTGAAAESFDAFYVGSRQRTLRTIYAMTGDLGDAQDLVQEAYARAWQRWGTVSTYEDPEAWVRTVAWRLAASRFRKARNGVAALLRHGPPVPTPGPEPDNVALVAALRRLPDAQRRAIVLHHLGGRSVAEVARETGAPEGTVKARLARGRAALAGLMTEPPAASTSQEPADQPTPEAPHE